MNKSEPGLLTEITQYTRIKAQIEVANLDDLSEQKQLELTLRVENDATLRLLIIADINPNIAWETLSVLAAQSDSEKVAVAAFERINEVRSIKLRQMAYRIILHGSRYPSITMLAQDLLATLKNVHAL